METLGGEGDAIERKDEYHAIARSNRHLVNFYR
jgi:hypothetical protein